MISLQDFKKVELKVGEIEKVEEIKGSKNLYKLKVNFGSEVRQIVSGIKNYYKPEELEGKQFVFVTNLEHATIMGEVSEGMILAAVSNENVVLIKPEKPIENGTKIS
ncbi:MAG: methionine--tRNA ligase subunit beta [Candidatus Aenigmarchaeota archaeon]|nr:methionine--tRNA ligase subunit beta [Candidatus Aenigmarchaeota archaeon]MCX8179273.1 methionine--tRNA ligase subunit beta [Candidatus Aenigmarchaeota archaeon]